MNIVKQFNRELMLAYKDDIWQSILDKEFFLQLKRNHQYDDINFDEALKQLDIDIKNKIYFYNNKFFDKYTKRKAYKEIIDKIISHETKMELVDYMLTHFKLNDKEYNFLVSLKEYYGSPTERQSEWLINIYKEKIKCVIKE